MTSTSPGSFPVTSLVCRIWTRSMSEGYWGSFPGSEIFSRVNKKGQRGRIGVPSSVRVPTFYVQIVIGKLMQRTTNNDAARLRRISWRDLISQKKWTDIQHNCKADTTEKKMTLRDTNTTRIDKSSYRAYFYRFLSCWCLAKSSFFLRSISLAVMFIS